MLRRDTASGFKLLFLMSFSMVTLRILALSLIAFIPVFMSYNGDYRFYRNILQLFGTILSVVTVAAGYWYGKKADVAEYYRDYIRVMAYGWILSELLMGVGWFLSEDIVRYVFEVALMRGLSGYSFVLPMFSGIVLGWLIEDKFSVSRVWSQDILRYVLVYQGAVLIQSLISVYLSHTLQAGASPARFGFYITALSFALTPLRLWFLWKMYQTGKQVELGVVYGSILFTLWTPRAIVMIIGSVLEMLFLSQMSAFDWLFNLAENIVGVTIGVFGSAFALLCFGYIHSRYMHVEMLKNIEKE